MATPTTFSVAQHTTAIWLVTFDLPPINPITPELVRELHDLVIQLETDEQVKVAVFNSANDGFFLNHFDLARGAEFPV